MAPPYAEWLDEEIQRAETVLAGRKGVQDIFDALIALTRGLKALRGMVRAVPKGERLPVEEQWPTFSMLLHGCKGCGEECHPVKVAGYWICPDCHSMDLTCIEQDTALLTEAIDRLRPPTTDAERERLQGHQEAANAPA